MKIKVSNTKFKNLQKVGTRSNNSEIIQPAQPTQIGLSITQNGIKKAIHLEMVVPTKRTAKGSRRTTRVNLTGTQARQIYETLQKFYETQNPRNDTPIDQSYPGSFFLDTCNIRKR